MSIHPMSEEERIQLLGVFTGPDQVEPFIDPAHDAPCPLCGKPIHPADVRTISLMACAGINRSYFYRAHRTCHEALTPAEQRTLDALVAPEAFDNDLAQ